MKNILLEKNEVLIESIDLPIKYGEICASKSMQSLNDTIYDIIHENDEFSQEFIDKMKKMEDEEFIDVDDLDSLFE
ncbi:MAG: hypothetical protein BZ136_09020 [Methanosphaera sp. rholeuAM74]|nr:MAG: hypothetical protein BZ136_09020 [Methanosphaera sp. rholeuAM74]